jgi:hypothetical protein
MLREGDKTHLHSWIDYKQSQPNPIQTLDSFDLALPPWYLQAE